jgi:hypothetical protein
LFDAVDEACVPDGGVLVKTGSKRLLNNVLKVQNKTILDIVAIATLLHIRVLLELLQHFGSPSV